MRWRTVALTDICRPRQWKTIPTSVLTEAGYPVFGANGIIGFYSEYNHEKPTVVITCRGATCGTVGISLPKSYITGNAMALDDLDEAQVDQKFLYYQLSRRGFRDVISGSAQPQITGQGLSIVRVALPPLPEQKRIAAILDKADEIRRKREKAVKLTDSFLRSVFLEMFGDPVKNPNEWRGALLGDICDVTSGVTKGRKLNGKETRPIPYLRVANVQDSHLNLSEIKIIPATDDDLIRYNLLKGDMLMTEGGDPDKLGRGTLWNEEVPNCIFQNHIFRVRVKGEHRIQLHPEFLSAIIGSSRGKLYFLREAKQTTGIATINSRQLKEFPLLLPPIELQNNYAQIKIAVTNHLRRNSDFERLLSQMTASLRQTLFGAPRISRSCSLVRPQEAAHAL
jgi:type I restriction enzyme S subunit